MSVDFERKILIHFYVMKIVVVAAVAVVVVGVLIVLVVVEVLFDDFQQFQERQHQLNLNYRVFVLVHPRYIRTKKNMCKFLFVFF